MATGHKFRLNDKVKIKSHIIDSMIGEVGIISERTSHGTYTLRHSDGEQSAWYDDSQLELIEHDAWEDLDLWEDLESED